MAAKRYPSYSVELVGYGETHEPIILTLYTARLASEAQDWWYARKRPAITEKTAAADSPVTVQI
jgi:hypothetical protein